MSTIIWFFVISCILSLVFFLLACYYLNMGHGNRKIIDSYTRYQVCKIIAGSIFWWVTFFVVIRKCYTSISKPVTNVFKYVVGDNDE